ncbi:class I SAM-dependent methyltransferase [Mesorhizobium sp. B2-3-4]|uniref:class I SAM-dependent methyltransferase n=1 Tax=Mesorhizobium sp. B2-3-4 TaxID=2589959 RepID=UPI00112BCBB9|nr:class I SAM-dependent methyltransferase [Mesorhizobium sp. B2-3-4]TPM37559.1 class I SAM-dependent methyltransferase [Mesorhizobium sp. B2-3-4]
MRIASFTMFKNEEAILGPFCDQLDEFFDVSFFVDHASVDGSALFVEDRLKGAQVFKLVADGYPQAELANIFSKLAFEIFEVDFLFFLDCDEYLPFASRSEFEKEIVKGKGYLNMNWRNVVPINLDGVDSFTEGFVTLPKPSKYTKVGISRKFYRSYPEMTITQGYHTVIGIPSNVHPYNISSIGLLHMPIPFREKYLNKMGASAKVVRDSKFLHENRLGVHWVEHDDLIKRRNLTDGDLNNIGLLYPEIDLKAKTKPTRLDFNFPYVRSRFDPGKLIEISSEIADSKSVSGRNRRELTLLDRSGNAVLVSDGGVISKISVENLGKNVMGRESKSEQAAVNRTKVDSFDPDEIQDRYIAPLFSLPRKLPLTAWGGHIPFLFVLFRNLKPACYVDLGVHFGASLIAAATAAQSYDLKADLWGVDTWEGDDHAGRYEGDKIHDDLQAFLDRSFSGVHLIRSTFDEARAQFEGRPVDLLHIDGLHTYEAVKHDYEHWLPVLSDKGVVMFHDISVRERDFGVWRLWDELKQKFPSLEFTHSHGLGVLFVGSNSLSDPYLRLMVEDARLFSAYRATVSQIAELLPLRSAYLATEVPVEQDVASPVGRTGEGDAQDVRRQLTDAQWALQHYKNQLQTIRQHYEGSTSWRVSAPLRYLKRLMGK